jgi:hypothetical protein
LFFEASDLVSKLKASRRDLNSYGVLALESPPTIFKEQNALTVLAFTWTSDPLSWILSLETIMQSPKIARSRTFPVIGSASILGVSDADKASTEQ